MTPATEGKIKLTPMRRWELWTLAGQMRDDGMMPDAYPNMHDEVWEIARLFNVEVRIGETDDLLFMWEDYETHELVRVLLRTRSELFTCLTGSCKFTPEQASNYLEIKNADKVLNKYPEIVELWRERG